MLGWDLTNNQWFSIEFVDRVNLKKIQTNDDFATIAAVVAN